MVWWLVHKRFYYAAFRARQKESTEPFAFHLSYKFEISEPEGRKRPENSEALSGHSFCFFGTECLEVQGQLGRLAGRVVEGGKSRRQRERERERRGRPYRTICDEAHLHNGT